MSVGVFVCACVRVVVRACGMGVCLAVRAGNPARHQRSDVTDDVTEHDGRLLA